MSKSSLSIKSPVIEIPYIGEAQSQKLQRLGIFTVNDLLYHIPVKYKDTSDVITISQLLNEKEGTIKAKVEKVTNIYTRSRKVITKAKVSDDSGIANIVWFNQRYIINSLQEGDTFLFDLKLPSKPGSKDHYCSDFERINVEKGQAHLGRVTPIYDQTAGVSSKWLRARLIYLKDYLPELLEDNLPDEIREEYDLISLSDAIDKIHFPESFDDVHLARSRVGFDEMLELAIKLEQKKKKRLATHAPKLNVDERKFNEFISTLKFELTNDQKNSIKEIHHDLAQGVPMSRLLNGDVGSGKTIVAAFAAYTAAINNYTTVIMAPTTVLAHQHFKSFSDLLSKFDIKVQLLISGELLEPTIKPQVIVGTHAILYENFMPTNVGLVIVDEQHRFGVAQREFLQRQDQQELFPHYLTMTATPIPRTLTNIVYGDMDVSIIKEMPKFRLPVESHLVPYTKREDCYNWIKKQITQSENTEQAYMVFPLVEESEKSDMLAATQAHDELSKTLFKDFKLGLLHGRMKDQEKDEILTSFKNKEINILISTTVIEVGIDVSDATIILIENAERFGLAQLHQLRGRVGRGSKQSYCFVIPSKGTKKDSDSLQRLNFFVENSSGFSVAEYDLGQRGPGEVYGDKQSGIPEFKVASMSDLDTLKKARSAARYLMKSKDL
jgi:ATP-dependent DNA helicase RecG